MMRRYQRKSVYVVILSVLVLALVFQVGYTLLTKRNSIYGTGKLIIKEEQPALYGFSYTIESWYNNSRFYYNLTITLTNLTGTTVNGWEIVSDIPPSTEIVSCWSSVCQLRGGKLVITNESYNRTIPAGGEINFGLQLSSNTDNLRLQNVFVNQTPVKTDFEEEDGEVPPDKVVENLNVIVNETNRWQSGNGYTGQYNFVLTNESGVNIKSWEFKVEVESNSSLVNLWGANYAVIGTDIHITNTDYNGSLSNGSSITVGAQIFSTNTNYQPTIKDIKGTR